MSSLDGEKRSDPVGFDRSGLLDRLQEGAAGFQVIVVGGGATGLGVGVEAASRGYRTVVLEQHDFAKGTSSRSTKLVHGGVRYLQQGEVSLVLEALHERGLLLQNAPHLAGRLAFVVPTYQWWQKCYYGLGLKTYDLMAGRLGLGGSRSLTPREVLEQIPTLIPQRLQGGILYYDGLFDDSRLAVNLAQTIADLGGLPLNYMKVTGLLQEGGAVRGVHCVDQETGREYRLRGRVVVNATGVFSDSIRRMDDPGARGIIQPSQGVHLVLDRKFLPGNSALLVPRTDDGRVLFAVPWHGRVVVGTTDTPVEEVSLEPRPLQGEVELVLRNAARYLAAAPGPGDVRSVFAGLRPLVGKERGGDTAALSRDHHLEVSASGLVTTAGGKWTTYRRMGQQAVDRATEVAGLPPRPSRSAHLGIHGWTEEGGEEPLDVYGSDAPALSELTEGRAELAARLHPSLPYLKAQVVWAVRREFARTVEDVLARRTRALLLDAAASAEAAPAVAEIMAGELGRDGRWRERQVAEYAALAAGYLLGH